LVTQKKEDKSMATYIILANYTQKGIESIKDSPDRLEASKVAFEAMGAEVKAFYLVTGQYDMVIVVEAPDDITLAKLVLSVGSRGAVRLQTIRAYTESEYRQIIEAIPRPAG
jgi:uncharacterized protein with GYD domain